MEYLNAAVKDLSIDKIRNAAEDVMNQHLPKSEMEKKVLEVLSHKNWGTSSTKLNELANDTYDYEKYNVITKLMWEAMDGRPAAWRQVFKSLTLLEHLLKNGSDQIVEDARSKSHKIRTLYNFNYYEGTTDRGVGVREKAKQLMELLQDNDIIREERLKARKLREKFGGGMSGVGSNGGRYEGYGNDSYSKNGYGNDGFDSGSRGYGNSGIGSGGSSSRAYSGRYSDEQTNTKESSSAAISDPEPHFASAPEPKPKVKKSKKKKQKEVQSAPAPAAPEVDLFAFDDAPAPAPVNSTTDDAAFDAFQEAPATTAFDAFGSSTLEPVPQIQQTQATDAFGSTNLFANNTVPQQQTMNYQVAGGLNMMQQQSQMVNMQGMMNQKMPTANTKSNVMGGGNVSRIQKTSSNEFGNFSSAKASNDNDDFGDFSSSNNNSKISNGDVKADPVSKLISLDSLTANKKNEKSKASEPIPAPSPAPMMGVHPFQIPSQSQQTKANITSNPDMAFSGIDGLHKAPKNIMAPASTKKTNSGQQGVMLQQTGPTAIDTMGMPSPQQTTNKAMNAMQQQQQQMMYSQQVMGAGMPVNNFNNMNGVGMNQMNMMYTPQQQQAMMMNMQQMGGMQPGMQMNPMMMMNMQQMGGMNMGVMGGQSSDKNNMLGGQQMGDGSGFR